MTGSLRTSLASWTCCKSWLTSLSLKSTCKSISTWSWPFEPSLWSWSLLKKSSTLTKRWLLMLTSSLLTLKTPFVSYWRTSVAFLTMPAKKARTSSSIWSQSSRPPWKIFLPRLNSTKRLRRSSFAASRRFRWLPSRLSPWWTFWSKEKSSPTTIRCPTCKRTSLRPWRTSPSSIRLRWSPLRTTTHRCWKTLAE